MAHLWAQGDILIERVDDTLPGSARTTSVANGCVVLASGEKTGHHHRLVGSATLYRDDVQARQIPHNLYIGHVRVEGASARLEHEEHAPITLQPGLYRVRQQRQLEPTDVGLRALED